MSKTLLHAPKGHHSFTFYTGCGKPHEYDGKGIDCPACVEAVRLLSPEERIAHPALRGPVPVQGASAQERDAFRREFETERERASWHLEEKAAEEPKANGSEGESDVSAAFRAGQAMAQAGLPRANPFDGRSKQGKDWLSGYDSAE